METSRSSCWHCAGCRSHRRLRPAATDEVALTSSRKFCAITTVLGVCTQQPAGLDQVEVKVLNQAVRRNSSRFPGDFMFQLTAVEVESPRSQFVTLDGVEEAASSAQGRGKHLKYRPCIGFAPLDDKT